MWAEFQQLEWALTDDRIFEHRIRGKSYPSTLQMKVNRLSQSKTENGYKEGSFRGAIFKSTSQNRLIV